MQTCTHNPGCCIGCIQMSHKQCWLWAAWTMVAACILCIALGIADEWKPRLLWSSKHAGQIFWYVGVVSLVPSCALLTWSMRQRKALKRRQQRQQRQQRHHRQQRQTPFMSPESVAVVDTPISVLYAPDVEYGRLSG